MPSTRFLGERLVFVFPVSSGSCLHLFHSACFPSDLLPQLAGLLWHEDNLKSSLEMML